MSIIKKLEKIRKHVYQLSIKEDPAPSEKVRITVGVRKEAGFKYLYINGVLSGYITDEYWHVRGKKIFIK